MDGKGIAFLCIFALVAVTPCLGITITVDDDDPCADYSRIQDAINAAQNGDTVLVCEGHYYENIDFRGKAITVTGTDPNDPNVIADTIVDANGDGVVVSFHMGEGTDSVITGFTITGGHAKFGAGICCWEGASATITNCHIVSNCAEDISRSQGGGIYSWGSAEIAHCLIRANSVHLGGGGIFYRGDGTIRHCIIEANMTVYAGGGGILCYGSGGGPTITNCCVENNISGGDGGGVSWSYSSPSLLHCIIKHNSTVGLSANGGGLAGHGGSVTVSNCEIVANVGSNGGGISRSSGDTRLYNSILIGNQARQEGGGVYHTSGSFVIRNCTIDGNLARYGGAGIHCGEGASAVISNNVVCRSPSGAGICAIYADTVIISYNDVWHNIGGDYGGWAWPGEGDISVDPCFIAPGHWEDPCNTPEDLMDDVWVNGDYHLHHDSLCINAGDPCVVPDPCEMDMDGESRIRLGRVDIGADEAGSNPADFDESGLVEVGDFSTFAAAWLSDSQSDSWNEACDISQPTDGLINELDLAVYGREWLWEAHWH